jgi:peptidoglycan/LPS O-acetylase OafA/YrhL
MKFSPSKSFGPQGGTANAGIAPGPARNTLVSIQWLRAIAAIMVTVHHATYFSDLLSGQTARELWGFSSWFFGVHIFFVVSGFIMIHTTHNFGEPGAWRQFLARRLIRVVPLYWVLTTLMVVGVVLSPHSLEIAADKVQYILGSYFFLPVLRTEGDLRPILGQGWTLDYEMFFYVAFALAVLVPRRWGILALTLIFAGLVWLGRNLSNDTPVLFTWTDGLILEFLFGVFVGLAYERNWRLPGWAATISILSGAGLVIANLQGPTFLVAGVPATLIVGGFVLGPALQDSLATSWLTRVGDASYSLYLTHVFVLNLAYKIWTMIVGEKLPASAFLGASILVSILIGLMVYQLVERPMTNFLQRRLLGSRRTKTGFSVRAVGASS